MTKRFAIVFLPLLPLVLTACLALPQGAQTLPPPTITLPEERVFSTVAVSRGDISFEANPFAIYMPTRVERQLFNVDGLPLLGIFVALGDIVAQDDIIAALDAPEIEAELAELHRRRTRLELELTLAREQNSLAINLASAAGRPADNARFLTAISGLQADLALLDTLIAHVDTLNEERFLRATMDGVVTDTAIFAQGMISDGRQSIAVISDAAFSSFVVTGQSALHMQQDGIYQMTLSCGVYDMRVVDPEEFGFIADEEINQAFLIFDNIHPEEGFDTQGRIHIPLDTATNVLYIPTALLRRYEGRDFVYLYENGLRTVRDVTAGLEGGGVIEIISGLAEGELVIQ